MAVPISNVTRRVVFTASGTGPYSFTFEILANTDIAVYKDDTLLTLTTDYTVTINSNGTGSITLVTSPTGATQIAIVGNRTIQRTTDFVTGGDFFANTVNDEMDQQTIFAQQNAEGLQRALQAPQTDPTSIDMTLPRKAERAGKLLSFSSTGNPVASDSIGNNRGNWAAATAYLERDLVKDTSNSNIYQCKTAHTSTGSQPISSNTDSAKWYLIVDASAAATSAAAAAASEDAAAASETAAASSAETSATSASNAATSASSASTSASNASTSATAAASSATSAAASYDAFDDRYLGNKSSSPSVDNDGGALLTGALYFDTVANEMRVYTGTAWKATGSAVNGTSNRLTYTATAAQTTFSITYDVGYVDVYLNGVKQLLATDFTATSGTNIVFASGLTAGDIVDIVAYGAFEVANTYTQAQTNSLLDAKQNTLVSGTNIKTINGSSVLGSGDLVIEGFTLAQAQATSLCF